MSTDKSSKDRSPKAQREEIGEGDRVSARRYNEHTRQFVESELGKGRSLHPDDREIAVEPGELLEAERKALERAKEQDPQVSRDYRTPTKSSRDKDRH